MANGFYRGEAIKLVRQAVDEYSCSAGLEHAGLIGKVREIALRRIFQPFLPEGAEIGSGKIVDHQGNQSCETDLVLYFPRVMPAILHSGDLGLYPVDACIHAFEVKSTSSAAEIKDAMQKAVQLRRLSYLPGFKDDSGNYTSHSPVPVAFAYFAFGSDLSGKERPTWNGIWNTTLRAWQILWYL